MRIEFARQFRNLLQISSALCNRAQRHVVILAFFGEREDPQGALVQAAHFEQRRLHRLGVFGQACFGLDDAAQRPLNVLGNMSRQASDGDAVLLGDGAVADAVEQIAAYISLPTLVEGRSAAFDIYPTPFGRRNFMKNDPGSNVFSMIWERFSTLFLFA